VETQGKKGRYGQRKLNGVEQIKVMEIGEERVKEEKERDRD
jgi:hypothetical protein